LKELTFSSPVTFFVGENGSGKSTLLESIAVSYGFNPEGGSKNISFSTSDTHSCLSDYLILAKNYKRPKDGYFLRAESFYNLATEIDVLDKDYLSPPLLPAYGGNLYINYPMERVFWHS
jgi:predicted ATPase